MKKLVFILLIIVVNLFYYNIIALTDGSLIYLSSNEDLDSFENLINLLIAKKIAYLKLVDNDNICLIRTNSKIIPVNLNDEQLELICSVINFRGGIVQEKTIFVGIVSLITIMSALCIKTRKKKKYN